jgi:DNA phosphorothioation-dependent restriction protein DptH
LIKFNSIRKVLKEERIWVGCTFSVLESFATSENDTQYILTWVIHVLPEIKMKEVESLFSLDNKLQKKTSSKL